MRGTSNNGKLCALLLLFVVALGASAKPTEAIILDADTAMLLPHGLDIDDDLAVLWLIATIQQQDRFPPSSSSPTFRFAGLTSTFGNALTQYTHQDALELLGRAGLEAQIPSFEGAPADKRHPFTRQTDASTFIIDAVRAANASNQYVTIVCTGANTNTAAAITQAPDIIPMINRLIIGDGDLNNPPLVTDYENNVNLHFDLNATNVLFTSPIPKIFINVELMMQASFTETQVNQLRTCTGSVAYQSIDRISQWQQEKSIKLQAKYGNNTLYPTYVGGGFIPWDVYTVAYVTNPELFSPLVRYQASVHGLHVRFVPNAKGNAATPLTLLNREKFLDMFVKKLCSVRYVSPSV